MFQSHHIHQIESQSRRITLISAAKMTSESLSLCFDERGGAVRSSDPETREPGLRGAFVIQEATPSKTGSEH